jgi:hypothetical protein
MPIAAIPVLKVMCRYGHLQIALKCDIANLIILV